LFASRVTALCFVRNWLPALLWVLLLLGASTDLMSSQQTSRIISPILRWFNPEIRPQTIRQVQFYLRKTGHLTGYAILAVLLWRGFQANRSPENREWNWGNALLAFGLTVICAAADEFHQSFVSTRDGSGWDVLLDATGAALGLSLIWIWHKWRPPEKTRDPFSDPGFGQMAPGEQN
jgi:VanZ family protein